MKGKKKNRKLTTTIREKIKSLLKGGRNKEKYLGKKPDGRKKQSSIICWFLWFSPASQMNYVRKLDLLDRKAKTYKQWNEYLKEHLPVIEAKYRERVAELINKNLYLKDFIGWKYVTKREYTVLAQKRKAKPKGKKND